MGIIMRNREFAKSVFSIDLLPHLYRSLNKNTVNSISLDGERNALYFSNVLQLK